MWVANCLTDFGIFSELAILEESSISKELTKSREGRITLLLMLVYEQDDDATLMAAERMTTDDDGAGRGG